MVAEFKAEGNGRSIEDFVKAEAGPEVVGKQNGDAREGTDVVLSTASAASVATLARILIEKTGGGDGLRLRARSSCARAPENDLVKRASLLRRDSVHGRSDGTTSPSTKKTTR